MGTLITFTPGGTGPGSIAHLVWASSQGMLQAAMQGHRQVVDKLGIWLINTSQDPRCTPTMVRVIDHTIEAATRRLAAGPAPEAQPCAVVPLRPWRFEPIQPDDGEVA
ncbi:hypothetical protein V5F79_01215 [Xanthobacter flavus]|uniref:hypothetical protein n=1 Tax=Xanthobacter flavus TaxID=281 RepID=UPI00372CE506